MVEKAHAMGQGALGLCDRDGLYGEELADEEGKQKLPNWFVHGLFA